MIITRFKYLFVIVLKFITIIGAAQEQWLTLFTNTPIQQLEYKIVEGDFDAQIKTGKLLNTEEMLLHFWSQMKTPLANPMNTIPGKHRFHFKSTDFDQLAQEYSPVENAAGTINETLTEWLLGYQNHFKELPDSLFKYYFAHADPQIEGIYTYEFTLTNSTGQRLSIRTENFNTPYHLPWIIQLDEHKTISYTPEVSIVIQQLLCRLDLIPETNQRIQLLWDIAQQHFVLSTEQKH